MIPRPGLRAREVQGQVQYKAVARIGGIPDSLDLPQHEVYT